MKNLYASQVFFWVLFAFGEANLRIKPLAFTLEPASVKEIAVVENILGANFLAQLFIRNSVPLQYLIETGDLKTLIIYGHIFVFATF